jgi:eukaryotic-like serine/threonine-protein kinase
MQPELIGGRYRVQSAIGRGGMGTVWLCRDETLHRDVAVKQVGLLPGESVTDSARAFREARSSAALSHRNVVTVFDVVEEDGAIWLVMEHVPGRSLSQIIKQDGPLDPAVAADIGAQVADGLQAAHAAGIVHRDVKPGNVLVREDGVAKVSDFGIARSHGDPALTQSGFLTGTPSYFSPELARGGEPGPANDVWALGATLYYAVEGKPPYRPQKNPVAVLHDIANGQPPRPGSADFLEPALLRMMDRNPDSRWSMADAAHGLRRLADRHSPEHTRENTVDTAPTRQQSAARGVVAAPASARASAPAPTSLATTDDEVERDDPSSYDDDAPPYDPGYQPQYGDGGARRRRRAILAALVAAAVVVVLAGIAWAASLRDDPGGSGTAGDEPSASVSKSAQSPSEDDSATEQSSESSPSPSDTSSSAESSPSSSTAPSSKAAFLRSYFSAAPGGSDQAWAMLTPRFQSEVGRSSYNGFWRSIESVDVSGVTPAGGDSVVATLLYTNTEGGTSRERHRLDLQRSGDSYLIDDDNPA